MKRPADGIFTKFNTVVMADLCALVPDFADENEASAWFKKFVGSAAFKRRQETHTNRWMHNDVVFKNRPYACTDQADVRWEDRHPWVELSLNRRNKMQVLHILAHVLQPAEGKWHGGEFGKTFLDLVQLAFDAKMKKAAKQVLMKHKVKTTVKNYSEEQRAEMAAKTHARFHQHSAEDMEAGLREMLEDLRKDKAFGLGGDDD